jgi:hypothetical protein
VPPELPLTGGCACGAVRFAISAPLQSAGYCHCNRCQRRTGTAASANAMTSPGSFALTSGEEHVRVWAPDGGWEKAFCALCGSALFSRQPGGEGRIGVRLGALDGDPGIAPTTRQYVAYAASWEPIPDDGLERFPEAVRR